MYVGGLDSNQSGVFPGWAPDRDAHSKWYLPEGDLPAELAPMGVRWIRCVPPAPLPPPLILTSQPAPTHAACRMPAPHSAPTLPCVCVVWIALHRCSACLCPACSGWGYLLSRDLVEHIVSTAQGYAAHPDRCRGCGGAYGGVGERDAGRGSYTARGCSRVVSCAARLPICSQLQGPGVVGAHAMGGHHG